MINCGLCVEILVYLYSLFAFEKRKKTLFFPRLYFAGLPYLKILFCNLKTPADWQLERQGSISCVKTPGEDFLF